MRSEEGVYWWAGTTPLLDKYLLQTQYLTFHLENRFDEDKDQELTYV